MLNFDETVARIKAHSQKMILAGNDVPITLAVENPDGSIDCYRVPEEPPEEAIELVRQGQSYIVYGQYSWTRGADNDVLPDRGDAMIFIAQNWGERARVWVEEYERSSVRPRLEWTGPGEVQPEQCNCDWIGLLPIGKEENEVERRAKKDTGTRTNDLGHGAV